MTDEEAKKILEKEQPNLTIWNVRDLPGGFVFMATEPGEIPQVANDPYRMVSKKDGDVTYYVPMASEDPDAFFNTPEKEYKKINGFGNQNDLLSGINMTVKISKLKKKGR